MATIYSSRHPFATIATDRAVQLANLNVLPDEYVSINRLLYDGDHWRDSDGWMGPIPGTTDGMYAEIKKEIRRMFCSRNVVKEVVDRKVDGLLQRAPTRSFSLPEKPLPAVPDAVIPEVKTEDAPSSNIEDPVNAAVTDAVQGNPEPTPEELAAAAALEARNLKLQRAQDLSRDWWKKRNVLRTLKEVYGRSQIGERTVVRLYVPRGLLIKDEKSGKTRVPKGSIEECMELVYAEVALPGTAGVGIDPDTQREAAVYQAKVGTNLFTEIVFVEDNKTIIRTTSSLHSDIIQFAGNVRPLEQEHTIEMDGLLTMYEARIRSIITQQVRENQDAINLAKTMQNRNTITAGFLERIVLDAMPPGKWVPNPNKPGEEMYEVGPFNLGAGETNFFYAAEYRETDEQGVTKSRFGNPSVSYREPSSPDNFMNSKRDCYQDILEETGQSYVLLDGESQASGKSRVTAKDTFMKTLEDDAGEIKALAEWLMKAPLCMAAFFADNKGYFDELEVEASINITLGPPSSEETRADNESVRAGLMSRRTAIINRGAVTDADEEMRRIAADQIIEVRAESFADRLRYFERLVKLNVDVNHAATIVGITDGNTIISNTTPSQTDPPIVGGV